MHKVMVAFVLFTTCSIAGIAVAGQTPGSESGPPGAGPPGYQSWAGRTPSTQEQMLQKHETAAAHQSGKSEPAKKHGLATEKASAEAHENGKEALTGGERK